MTDDLTPIERAGLPNFLRYRDYSYREERELRRDQYAQRGEQDRAMRLNYGYGQQPFTVEDALVWAERRAERELP